MKKIHILVFVLILLFSTNVTFANEVFDNMKKETFKVKVKQELMLNIEKQKEAIKEIEKDRKVKEEERKRDEVIQAKSSYVKGSKLAWMQAAGIDEKDYGYTDYIISRESGWNPNAVNNSTGACGLAQSMSERGSSNWNDPVASLRWFKNYCQRRYGSIKQAYDFWISRGWY